MSNYTVFYSDWNSVNIQNNSLVRESDLFKKSFVEPSFKKCPVWNHRNNRTFLVTSPVDVEFSIKENYLILKIDGKIIENAWDYGDIIPEDMSLKNPVVQLKFPNYFFWTEEKNIWFEYIDHPMTSLRNNCIAIGGWFNISNYSRGTSFAFEMVDRDVPVIIKKNDPIARIRFYSSDMNNGIKLKQVERNSIDFKKEEKKFYQNQSKVRGSNIIRKVLFGKFSECPFKFIHKK